MSPINLPIKIFPTFYSRADRRQQQPSIHFCFSDPTTNNNYQHASSSHYTSHSIHKQNLSYTKSTRFIPREKGHPHAKPQNSPGVPLKYTALNTTRTIPAGFQQSPLHPSRRRCKHNHLLRALPSPAPPLAHRETHKFSKYFEKAAVILHRMVNTLFTM